MTKNLKWRLSKLPTPDEVRELVKDKILTHEEAREILFAKEDSSEPEVKVEELKSEIKFLRDLVEKLSDRKYSVLKEYIYQYPNPQRDWYRPYFSWCSTVGDSLISSSSNAVYLAGNGTLNSATAGTITDPGLH